MAQALEENGDDTAVGVRTAKRARRTWEEGSDEEEEARQREAAEEAERERERLDQEEKVLSFDVSSKLNCVDNKQRVFSGAHRAGQEDEVLSAFSFGYNGYRMGSG